MPSIPALRSWLRTLPADEVRILVARHEAAHGPDSVRYRGEPVAKKAATDSGTHLWVVKAPVGLLAALADCGASMAAIELCHRGFPVEAVRSPDLDGLGAMMGALPAPMAGLALHGLALRPESATTRLVRENWQDLWERALTPAEDLTEEGHLALHHTAPAARPAAEDVQTSTDATGSGVEQVEQDVQRLRTDGAALADRLDTAAAGIRAGLGTADPALAEDVAGWLADRARTAGTVRALDPDGTGWPAEDTYDTVVRIVASVRETEERQAHERRALLAELVEQRETHAKYVGLLEQESFLPAREGLERVVADLADRVRETEERLGLATGGLPSAAAAPGERLDGPVEPSAGAPADAVPAADEPEPHPEPEPEDIAPESTAQVDGAAAPESPAGSTTGADEDAQNAGSTGLDEPAHAGAVDTGPAGEAGQPGPLRRRTEPPAARPEQDAGPAGPGGAAEPLGAAGSEESDGSADTAGPVPVADVWTSGNDGPSAVERLIAQDRFAEAYWTTRAAGESQHRIQTLAFAHAAFHLPNAQAAFELQLQSDGIGFPAASEDREAYLVALAAALRSGLSAGWAPPLVTEFAPLPGLPQVWADVLQHLVAEVRQGLTLAAGEVLRASAAEPAVHRAEIGDRARQLQEDLPQRTITLQRGTKVLQTMCARDGRLGLTLRLVQEWAAGHADERALAEDMEQHYQRADAADRLIDATDRATRSPKQAKESIHSTAREQLRNHIKTVVDLLREAQTVAALPQHGRGREVGAGLIQAVAEAGRAESVPGPGGAALRVLVRWLGGESKTVAREDGLTPSADCLLALRDLAWLDDGDRPQPRLDGAGAADALAGLLEPVDVPAALRAHLDRGDVHLARLLLTVAGQGRLHGTGTPEAGELELWQQQVEDSAAVWRERVERRRRQAESLFAQIRVQNLLTPQVESELSGRLVDLRREEPAERFGARDADVRSLAAELRALVVQKTAELREQLAELPLDADSVARICDLLDADDVVTAEELLSFARQGRALPERQSDKGVELDEFLAGIAHRDAPAAGGTGVGARWWASHYAAGRSLAEATSVALDSWEALADPRKRSNAYQKHVGSVLRLLGLTATQVSLDEADRRDWSVMRLSVRADVSESLPGYVAALGSQAHRSYRVLLISDEQRGEGPLRHLSESAQGAHIILYLQPLGVEGRRRLAQRSRNRPQQAIVVDPAVLGWIAAREPRSFRAVQRVTLPWAGYVPYAPYLAGRVPPEVFKGRDTEKSAIMGREGSLFLYGGRQLGKSSLLRQVVDTFERDNREDHVAVYIDLRTADIGHAEPPERIWGVLAAELKRRGLLGPRLSERADGDTIAAHIRQWIADKPTRRVLVLADEADAFLNADARPVYTEGGQSTFRTVMRLQQLMQDTNRAFKVVFAGLHQVQRFNRLTNVITAHGGPGILVGPLVPKSAVELVVEPLAAVGLFFESPDLVWRILALTNYQANLVQIFCEGLVVEMQERALAADGSRPRITEADVQKVTASQGIQHQIKDRLRLTINLEDRYRVLTLILALRSLRDGCARGYTPQELLEEARAVWPEGFPPQDGVNEVRIDLVEMEGLGLVIQLQGGRAFAMRSPNVVNMLGTYEELDAELQTTEFSQPYDYNPRVARRSLGVDREQIARTSPLTDDQWHEALSAGTAVVAASPAMGSDLIDRAARLHIGASRKVLTYRASDDLVKAITEHTRLRTPHMLIVDLRGESLARVQETVERLTAYTGAIGQERPVADADGAEVPRRRALVVTDPLPSSALAGRGAAVVRPKRWNATSVRAWPESPFLSAEERRNLVEATGGWPGHVERVMSAVRGGRTRDAALTSVRLDGPESAATHLRRAGLDRDLTDRLCQWAEVFTAEEHRNGLATATPQDLSIVLETGIDEAEELLGRLEHLGVLDERPGGVTVDPVTFRALKTLQEAGEGGLG